MKFTDDSPIYIQIADHIRSEILAGRLKAGDQIMSTTAFATTYRINPATANKAFNQLVSEGIIYKQRGIGMFVTDEADSLLRSAGQESYADDVLRPAIHSGLALGLSATDITALISSILEETT